VARNIIGFLSSPKSDNLGSCENLLMLRVLLSVRGAFGGRVRTAI
jgi:hypothetical protein